MLIVGQDPDFSLATTFDWRIKHYYNDITWSFLDYYYYYFTGSLAKPIFTCSSIFECRKPWWLIKARSVGLSEMKWNCC